jgi:hypothetical protein
MPVQDALRNLYNMGGGRRQFFEMLSTYANRRTELPADRAAVQTGLDYDAIVEFLKELGHLKIGEFKLGRRGHSTRLIWHYSPRSVGDVAQGKAATLESYKEESHEEESASGSRLIEPVAASGLPGQSVAAMIAEAKNALAFRMGISPDQITITFTF